MNKAKKPRSNSPLTDLFHPLIAAWFGKRFRRPTDLQAQAWPLIASGEHLLVTAPTGSGKTLAAFLWAIDQLATARWPAGQTRVLYVSPLKALNNDIQRNLIGPLDELRGIFERSRRPFPDIRVLTRSGDTPPSERRRMIRRPPEILITTPESLNLLLSSTAAPRASSPGPFASCDRPLPRDTTLRSASPKKRQRIEQTSGDPM